MDRSSLAVYVCGPMTGRPRFNYPLFHLVTNYLRLAEREVISPTELDSTEMQIVAWASPDGAPTELAAKTGETWGDVLARDVRLIEKKVGAFALLPGWEKSRGARLEVFVGLLVGITDFSSVQFYPDGMPDICPIDTDDIRTILRRNMP